MRHALPGSFAAGLLLTAAVAVAACAASDGPVATFPQVSIGPDRTVSPAVALTRGDLARALGGQRITMQDAQVPFRPPESPSLTIAPRAVYQAVLPADPNGGFIVVYEFSDPDRADQAAKEQAAYLATGPGRVQSSLDQVDIVRVDGSTVVLYSWIPNAAQDPQAPDVQRALETLGYGVPVPS